MRPFPVFYLSDLNPSSPAQKWRAVAVQIWNTSDAYMSMSEFKFLATPGAASQPDTGTASASPSGSAASAFDGNTGSECYIPWNSGNNFLEFDFNNPYDIKEIYYQTRLSGWNYQAPHELSIQAFIGGTWVERGHLYGIPQWAVGEIRRYPVSIPLAETGGHRYWRLVPLSTYGAGDCTEIEVEFLQANGTNIGINFNTLPSNPNNTGLNALDGVVTGDNYCLFTPLIPLAIDFGYKRAVDHIRLTCRSSFLTQAIKDGRVDYSDDGSNWNEYFTFHGAATTPTANQQRTFYQVAPVSVSAPVVTGDTTNYGNLLTVGNGVWENTPTSFSKTWKDHTGAVVATGNSYTPISTDYRTTITCEVAATNSIGTTTYVVGIYVGSRVRSSAIYGGTATSVAVTWPTGTVVGDRVILFAETAWAPTVPGGWTQHDAQSGSNIGAAMFSKIMASADITAGGITISMTGSYGCSVAAVTCLGAPSVNSPTATRLIASGGTVTLPSAQAGDEALWYAGVRDGSAGTGTINVGNQLCQGDFASNQAHGRITNHVTSAGSESATVTHNGSCYFGGLLLR